MDGTGEARRVLEAAGLTPTAAVTMAAVLEQMHSEAWRRYHDWSHPLRMLRELASLGELPDRTAIAIAILFHDAVMVPGAADNEARSAAFCRLWMAEAGTVAETAAAMIPATDHKREPETAAAKLLCDLDLSILSASRDDYRAYVDGVRAEYAAVGDAAWAVGRSAVLEGFLRRPAIYRTAYFRDREAAARSNLQAERATLRPT